MANSNVAPQWSQRHAGSMAECPIREDNDNALENIIFEFRRVYEKKLADIEQEGGGDCLQLKIETQQKWIDDLTEQTAMMIGVIKELETEASGRVQMFENKLQQNANAVAEVMKRYDTYKFHFNSDEPFQREQRLESDNKSLLEFIRRARDDGSWSAVGLKFHQITSKDLFGSSYDISNIPKFSFTNKDIHFKDNLLSPNNHLSLQTGEISSTQIDEKDLEMIDNKNRIILQLQEENKKLRKFGDFEEMSKQLKCKTEEYEELKKSMRDMRNALTEEVALKHDAIIHLKKDIQILEDRCLQADKQTAFKDDIIKEMRKELKQLKQQQKSNEVNVPNERHKDIKTKDYESTKQLKGSIYDLRRKLAEDDEQEMNNIKFGSLDRNRNKLIGLDDSLDSHNCNIKCSTRTAELEALMKAKIVKIEELKMRCKQLEESLDDAQGRADNLQKAVDLYLNSINVLESTNEKNKTEIEHQKMTIVNLQDALVIAKFELEEMKQKSQQDLVDAEYLLNVLYVNIIEMEKIKNCSDDKMFQLFEAYENLQNIYFNLEVEHFNSLQDIALYDMRLSKYQMLFKLNEDSKINKKKDIKKICEQNRCYEQIVQYFKEEMSCMSEQLTSLQQILKMSNRTCKEENDELINAVLDLHKINDRLLCQLNHSQERFAVETNINHISEVKIAELQQLIDMKNNELGKHDGVIKTLTSQLECSCAENQKLNTTLKQMNCLIAQLQEAIRIYEAESKEGSMAAAKIASCQKVMADYKTNLERKNIEYQKLENDYKEQYNILISTQKELQSMKEQNHKMRTIVEEARNQFVARENDLKCLCEKYRKAEAAMLKVCECEKDKEKLKSIIINFKKTLMNLNENELSSVFLNENFKKSAIAYMQKTNIDTICLNCDCEVDLLKKILNNLQSTLVAQSKKISEKNEQNNALHQEVNTLQMKMRDIQMELCKRDKDLTDMHQNLSEKERVYGNEEKRLIDTIKCLTNEMAKMKIDLQALRTTKAQLVATQDEMNAMKAEIRRMVETQTTLNEENSRLHGRLDDYNNSDDSKKAEMEKLLLDIQNLKETNKNLMRQNDDLTNELQCLNCCYTKLERKNRYITELNKNLETELIDMRNSRDDICAESRIVVDNVRTWLEEQRRINDQVKRQGKHYSDTVNRLTKEKQMLMMKISDAKSGVRCDCCDSDISPCKSSPRHCKPTCLSSSQNPNQEPMWNLGSDGSGTFSDRESPLDGQCSREASPVCYAACSVDEWSYRQNEETMSDDEFIQKIEDITSEIRKNNKIWKKCRLCNECAPRKEQ